MQKTKKKFLKTPPKFKRYFLNSRMSPNNWIQNQIKILEHIIRNIPNIKFPLFS